jgi:GT2 family glycosyltransferase
MLLRRQALDEVGWLNDGYFLYYEDVELGLRLRRAGWVVAVSPAVGAQQEPGNYRAYYRFRNQILFWRWNYGGRLRIVRAIGWQLLRSSVGWTFRRTPSEGVWAVRGILDGMRGLSGPPPLRAFQRRD